MTEKMFLEPLGFEGNLIVIVYIACYERHIYEWDSVDYKTGNLSGEKNIYIRFYHWGIRPLFV